MRNSVVMQPCSQVVSRKGEVFLPICQPEEILCSKEQTVRSTFLIQGLLGKDMKAALSFLTYDYVQALGMGKELVCSNSNYWTE